MRRYTISDASVHDSQKLCDILDASNTASTLWADSAYRSEEIEAKLEDRALTSRICHKGYRNRPLGARQKEVNKTRSSVRARVEHVFGQQTDASATTRHPIANHLPTRCNDRLDDSPRAPRLSRRKGGYTETPLAVREVASRPRFISDRISQWILSKLLVPKQASLRKKPYFTGIFLIEAHFH